MVETGKSSYELNHFISRVSISPVNGASFTGLDKLYHMVENHPPTIKRKEIRKWA